MDASTAHFIERMGFILESDGLPRIAGRILGLLLISEDARSLDDLACELGVSKGSVSTDARLLEQPRTSMPIRSPAVLERLEGYLERLEGYEEAYAFISQVISEALVRWQTTRGDRLAKVGASG